MLNAQRINLVTHFQCCLMLHWQAFHSIIMKYHVSTIMNILARILGTAEDSRTTSVLICEQVYIVILCPM